jgi:hypothetical protein
MISLRNILTPTMRVKFDYFRDGCLWYSTINGFQFPVPVNTSSTTVYLANDKAEKFEYWIKKQFNKNKEQK